MAQFRLVRDPVSYNTTPDRSSLYHTWVLSLEILGKMSSVVLGRRVITHRGVFRSLHDGLRRTAATESQVQGVHSSRFMKVSH